LKRLATITHPFGTAGTLAHDAESIVASRVSRCHQTITFAYDMLNG